MSALYTALLPCSEILATVPFLRADGPAAGVVFGPAVSTGRLTAPARESRREQTSGPYQVFQIDTGAHRNGMAATLGEGLLENDQLPAASVT